MFLGPIEILRHASPPVEALDIEHPLVAELGGKVRLLGYNIESGFHPGDGIHLTLFWQCLEEMGQDYTVFIQVWRTDTQAYVTGFDGPPVQGDYPTSLWAPGEIIVDTHPIDLSSLPPGEYYLLIGLYNPIGGDRLPAFGPDGPLPGYAVKLGTLQVARNGSR